METLIHIMHVVAIKDARAWTGMNPAQLSMLGFWNLIFVWLKVCCIIQSISPIVFDAKLILSNFSPGCLWLLSGNSCFCRGDSFVYGRLWMGWTRPRTWCAAWRTTTRPLDSGARGTAHSISGSCATSTFRSAGRIDSSRRVCWFLRLSPSGMTLARGFWRGVGSWHFSSSRR
jgi:hypothetical protein